MQLPILTQKRECGECDICCDGWLVTNVLGQDLWPGRPCHFKRNGCTIHEQRPHDPCRKFECAWLADNNIPEWMQPNKIKAIFIVREFNGQKYLNVMECGQQLDSRVLSWLFMQHINKRLINFRYQVAGGWNYVGTPEFVTEMQKYNTVIP